MFFELFNKFFPEEAQGPGSVVEPHVPGDDTERWSTAEFAGLRPSLRPVRRMRFVGRRERGHREQ